MPANRGLGSPDWSPQPDFPTHQHVEPTVDERVFQFDDETQVAAALLETDPTFEAYQWDLTEDRLKELALYSAQAIVHKRRELFADRKVQSEFELAKAHRDKRLGELATSKKAVVSGYRQSLATGEITIFTEEVSVGRAFG
jgi:hypothetical protein